jgi:hypothetical protein
MRLGGEDWAFGRWRQWKSEVGMWNAEEREQWNSASGLAITSFTASESAGVFGELHIVTAYGCACCRYIPIMILLIGK